MKLRVNAFRHSVQTAVLLPLLQNAAGSEGNEKDRGPENCS